MVLVKGLIFYKASFKNKIVKQNVHQAGSTEPTSVFHKLRFCSFFFFSFHAFLSNAVSVYVLFIEQ